ncbi:MAG: chorismate synthase [Clostridia bacterium]|nr:chorismate synthase [Clostridia bacterium]
MKNTFGDVLSVTLFGESHGTAIGAVLDGVAPGIKIDKDFISHQLDLRRPQGNISTPRKETDEFKIISGVKNGYTCGTPICIMIENKNIQSKDYDAFYNLPRPSHADFTGREKCHGFEDTAGGGHFSGRITAALVAAGAIIIPALNKKGIYIGTHIKEICGVNDKDFGDIKNDIEYLSNEHFAVIDKSSAEKMQEIILAAAKNGDSVGGILETAVIGVPAGVGEPWFDTAEGKLSHALFSVPAVKGVEFGAGFGFAKMKGSTANDSFAVAGGKIVTETNNNGGILGGITSGMPIILRTAVKPTPTISLPQKTVDMESLTEKEINGKGRHDPCIVHRARVVVDSLVALTLADMLSLRFGTDWLA